MYDLPLQWLNIKWEKKFVPVNPCNLIPHLGTRCLSCGVHLTKYQLDVMPNSGGTSDQLDPNCDQMSTWPEASSVWGYSQLVSDLTTHPEEGFKSSFSTHLHNKKNKKTNDLSKYTHYCKYSTLTEHPKFKLFWYNYDYSLEQDTF